MVNQPKQPFIVVEGKSKGEIWGNEIYDDRPLLHATGEHDLSVFNNLQEHPSEPISQTPPTKHWFKHWVAQIIIGLAITIIGGVAAAWLIKRFI